MPHDADIPGVFSITGYDVDSELAARGYDYPAVYRGEDYAAR